MRGLWPFITTQDDQEWDSFSCHMLSLIFMVKNLREWVCFIWCDAKKWGVEVKGILHVVKKKKRSEIKAQRQKSAKRTWTSEPLNLFVFCFFLLWRFFQTAKCLDENCEAAVDSVSGLNIRTTTHRLHCRHTHSLVHAHTRQFAQYFPFCPRVPFDFWYRSFRPAASHSISVFVQTGWSWWCFSLSLGRRPAQSHWGWNCTRWLFSTSFAFYMMA